MRVQTKTNPVELGNPDKVLFPAAEGGKATTKADLAHYFKRVAEAMLPHVGGRAVNMRRAPDGVDGDTFFQQSAPDYFPESVGRVRLEKREGGAVTHAVVSEQEALVYLADQAVVELHTWLSPADEPERPDRLVIDLDPAEEDIALLRFAARAVRDALQNVGLHPYVMTTGSKGLHVAAPLDGGASYEEVREFLGRVCDRLAQEHPDRLTTEQRKDKRKGRLYLDTGRNAYGQTSVAPYSPRAKAGAPVAAPLGWGELERQGFHPQRWTVANMLRRLGQKQDPWKNFQSDRGSVQDAMKELQTG